jgi:hypothetical protein
LRRILKNILEYCCIMSSSRSVAAARARRANGNNSSTSLRPGQMQQNQTQPQQHSRSQYINRQPPAQSSISEAPRKNPYDAKLSVSDAFALVTLRLGRVETILQKMDVSSIINKMEAGETTSEEAGTNVILKSLLSRIEDVENNAEINGGGGGMTDDDRKTISDLSTRLDSAKSEITDLKSTIFKMQTMLIDINQQMLPNLANSSPRKAPVARKQVSNMSVKVNENAVEEVSKLPEEEVSPEENNELLEEDDIETDDVDDGGEDNNANVNEEEEEAVALE